MAARLLLIRHAETEHNTTGRLSGWTDSPLSAEGWRQAARLAEVLAGEEPVEVLYSSPLERARRTAAAIADRVRIVLMAVDDLREWHLGACEGLTPDEVDALYPGLRARGRDLRDMEFCWPAGESRGAFYARVRRAFADITRRHATGAVAVVSHSAVLSTYLAEAVEGAPWHWPNYVLDNCAVSELLLDGTGARLLRHNVRAASSPRPAGA